MPSESIPAIPVANDRLLAVQARINHRWYRLVVDTGATEIGLRLDVIWDELQLAPLPQTVAQLSTGAVGTGQAAVYRLDEVVVGPFAIADLDAIALDWPSSLGIHGILGMNWLSAFPRVCLDLVGVVLELEWQP